MSRQSRSALHAHVRHHVGERREWDVSTLGVPINQVSLARTLLDFPAVPMNVLHRLGVRLTADQCDDIATSSATSRTCSASIPVSTSMTTRRLRHWPAGWTRWTDRPTETRGLLVEALLSAYDGLLSPVIHTSPAVTRQLALALGDCTAGSLCRSVGMARPALWAVLGVRATRAGELGEPAWCTGWCRRPGIAPSAERFATSAATRAPSSAARCTGDELGRGAPVRPGSGTVRSWALRGPASAGGEADRASGAAGCGAPAPAARAPGREHRTPADGGRGARGLGQDDAAGSWAREPARDDRVAWLSIDEADDEPVRFWTYLLSALETVAPS